ncbi:MAG TPA: hypothetical protein VMX75_15845, partial [Spirochaetia bacterium]|nr:hypothetical protein [Spirochaetia bacterium]
KEVSQDKDADDNKLCLGSNERGRSNLLPKRQRLKYNPSPGKVKASKQAPKQARRLDFRADHPDDQ